MTIKEIAKKSGMMGASYMVWRVLGFAYFFIVTNLLGPLQYGLLSLVMSIYEIAAIPHNALNNALIKYIAEKKQRHYLQATLKMEWWLGISMGILLWIFSTTIANLLNQPIETLVKLVAIFFMLNSFRETFSNAILGTSEIKYYVINETIFNLARLVILLLIITKIKNAFGVLVASIVTALFLIIISIIILKRIHLITEEVNIMPMVKYGGEFLILLLIGNLQPQIFIIALALFQSGTEIGYYKFLLNMVTLLLISLINMMTAVILNYYSSFHYKNEKTEIQNLFNLSLRMGLYITIAIGIGLLIILNPLIKLLFKEYSAAIPLVPFFVLFAIISSIDFLVVALIKGTDNLHVHIKALIASFATSVILSLALVPRGGTLGAVLAAIGGIAMLTCIDILLIKKQLNLTLDLLPKKQDYIMAKKMFLLAKQKGMSLLFAKREDENPKAI